MILHANAMAIPLADESVQCCVTSPPYWGLRDYGTAKWVGGDDACDHRQQLGGEGASSAKQNTSAGTQSIQYKHTCGKCGATREDSQLGLEKTPEEYVANMVAVFREVRRVLKDDGVLWLNLGDSYAGSGKGAWDNKNGGQKEVYIPDSDSPQTLIPKVPKGLKPKDLVGIPWLVAKALQAPYYTGRIKDESDRAWLAGFLDGEGTISFVERDRGENHTPTHDARVFITNCDDAPLRHFAAMTAGNVYQHDGERENRFGSRPCFRWQMGTHDGALLLRELYPYLRTKRKQAALIWTLYTTLRHKNGHARTPEDVVEKRRSIADLVRALNRGESVDMPSWAEPPPPCTEPGWYLRSDIIWSKPNPMPESVTDRPTKAHEYIFLMSKAAKYYYNAEAIAEKANAIWNSAADWSARENMTAPELSKGADLEKMRTRGFGTKHEDKDRQDRNRRTVWSIPTMPYPGSHFATFPEEIPRLCILAGSRPGDVILDPFGGSGTTSKVALELGRKPVHIDLTYHELARKRMTTTPAMEGLMG